MYLCMVATTKWNLKNAESFHWFYPNWASISTSVPVDSVFKNQKIQRLELVYIKNSKLAQIYLPWKVHFLALIKVKAEECTWHKIIFRKWEEIYAEPFWSMKTCIFQMSSNIYMDQVKEKRPTSAQCSNKSWRTTKSFLQVVMVILQGALIVSHLKITYLLKKWPK